MDYKIFFLAKELLSCCRMVYLYRLLAEIAISQDIKQYSMLAKASSSYGYLARVVKEIYCCVDGFLVLMGLVCIALNITQALTIYIKFVYKQIPVFAKLILPERLCLV